MHLHLLLLDEGFMSGAYTAVGLRDAGCRVAVVAAVGGHGHYDGRNISWSLAPRPSSDEYLATIDRLVRRGNFDLVLPLSEPIQALLWDATPSWSDRIFPSTEDWQRVVLRDKRRFAELMASRGLAIPRWCPVHDDTTLQAAVESLGLPVVVKGSTGRGGSTTWIARSPAEAADAATRARAAGVECFAQQYVSGPTYLVGGAFDEGRAGRIYAGVKHIQYPARTGPAAVIRSIHDKQLLNTAIAAIGALAWTGIASLDLARDVTGRFLLLEVNPRPWGSITAAAEAGVDLFGPLVELLRGGHPQPALEYRIGVESSVFPLTLLSSASWRAGNALASAAHELRDRAGPWHPWRQALHLAHRLARVARNWPG